MKADNVECSLSFIIHTRLPTRDLEVGNPHNRSRQADRQTDRQTNGQTDGHTTNRPKFGSQDSIADDEM